MKDVSFNSYLLTEPWAGLCVVGMKAMKKERENRSLTSQIWKGSSEKKEVSV